MPQMHMNYEPWRHIQGYFRGKGIISNLQAPIYFEMICRNNIENTDIMFCIWERVTPMGN